MAVDPQPTGAVTNDYLALREAKIARNEQRLRDLGLLRHVHVASSAAVVAAKTPVTRTHQAALPLRRSLRLERPQPQPPQQQQQQQQSLVVAMEIPKNENGQGRKRKKQSAASVSTKSNKKGKISMDAGMTVEQVAATLSYNDTAASPKNKNDYRNKNDSLTPSNSARSIRLNVETLISRCLGVPLSSTGKAFVMQTSVQLAACPPPSSHHTTSSISFNKYSGIQEWANNVVFLWVNLNVPQNEMRNDFTHHGRQVVFYGGSRMHDQTPVIQKLKLLGVQAAALATNKLDSAGGIVLWCRSFETCRKAFGPYVCLGRLSLVSYDPSSQPLMFVFQLQDYDTLVGDSPTRAVFANLTRLSL